MDGFCIQTGCCGPSSGEYEETTEPLSTAFGSNSRGDLEHGPLVEYSMEIVLKT